MPPSSVQILNHLQDYIRYSELKQMVDRLIALQEEKHFRSLAVLSVFPAEGKTLFCAATALSYSQTRGARVLLVDTSSTENKSSLPLKDCLEPFPRGIDYLALKERPPINAPSPLTAIEMAAAGDPLVHDADVMQDDKMVPITQSSDQYLIQKAAHPRDSYGLILLDTVSLDSRNKNNLDPLLVARSADASILIISELLLESRELNDYLKKLQDPSLHLLGVISNEELDS